ncbi:hypothetical protein A9X01_20735 [Mycobacterium asiaticum]|uniref:Uncharacterized protein n=2 Tax=Mycobacterium asiaticum TaxID=1790 RepID=A0A1A3C8Q6_MYCAS|nr:hypothetical protein A9X01_20735 [Mycobacterium asiaticum]
MSIFNPFEGGGPQPRMKAHCHGYAQLSAPITDPRGDFMDRTKAVAHRLGQARSALLRAQLALTLSQLLLWVSLIGGVVGAALLFVRRRAHAAEQSAAAAPKPAAPVTSDTSPASLP